MHKRFYVISTFFLILFMGMYMVGFIRTPLNSQWKQRFKEVELFSLHADKGNQSLEDVNIEGYDIKGLKLIEFGFINTGWKNIKATGQDWSYIIIQDSDFENVDFSDSNLGSITFRNVNFKDVSFKGGRMQDVIFEDCKFDNVDFTYLKESQLEFKNSTLTHPTFEFAHSSLYFEDSTIQSIQFSDLRASDFKIKGGSVTTDRHMYKLKIGKLVLENTELKDEGFPIDGQFGKIILKNLSSDYAGGGGIAIAHSQINKVIATDCQLDFLIIRGNVDTTIIKNFNGNRIGVWGGTFKKVLLENNVAKEKTGLFEAKMEYIYIRNLKTRALTTATSQFDDFFMDQVNFGLGNIFLEDTKIQNFRTRDVVFESRKRLFMDNSDFDFEHSEVEWKIYEMERKNPMFPELLPENRFKGYFTWEG